MKERKKENVRSVLHSFNVRWPNRSQRGRAPRHAGAFLQASATSPGSFYNLPRPPHARERLFYVYFIPPRKHLQHSSGVYLRDTGYTPGRRQVGSGPTATAWRVNWIHGGPKGSPPKSWTGTSTGTNERASQKFGPADRKFRARLPHARPPHVLALLNTRFNGSAFMHARDAGDIAAIKRVPSYPNALRSVVSL